MSYVIFRRILGQNDTIEISEQRYQDVVLAVDRLVSVATAEEIYDALAENYAELEKEILSAATDYMLFRPSDPKQMRSVKGTLARRALNFLTSARLYVDTIENHAESITDSGQSVMKDLKSSQYDAWLEYRVMEQIRNYSQHRGFPFKNITFNNTRKEEGERVSWHTFIIPEINADDFLEDKKFKKKVANELRSLGKRHPLMPFLRQYMHCLSTIHDGFRSVVKLREDHSLSIVLSCSSDFEKKIPGNKLFGLSVGVQKTNGVIDEYRQIHIGAEDYWKSLRLKNRYLINLPTSSVLW